MNMAFPQAGGADLDEAAPLPKFINGAAAEVTHTGPQAAKKLNNIVGDRAPVGDTPDNALGNQVAVVHVVGQVITVLAALLHGLYRSHAPVDLITPALKKDRLARTLFGPGEQAAEHDAVGAGREGFGDIAGVFNAAVGDQGNAGLVGNGFAIHDGRQLRHAHAGHHPGGADRTRPDADLDAVNAGFDQLFRALGGADIAGNDLGVLEIALDHLHGPDDIGRMAVRGINDDDIGPGLQKGLHPGRRFAADADGSPDPQPAQTVLAGLGIFFHLFDVLDGDHADQTAVLIHHQQFFDLVPVQELLGLLQGNSFRNGNQVLAGHHLGDLPSQVRLEPQIPVGDDAHQLAALGDGYAGNAVFPHQSENAADGPVRRGGHGIDDHAAFGFFNAPDLQSLVRYTHVPMNKTQTAGPGHADGGRRFGNRIHGGADNGNVQTDIPRQTGGGDDIFGQDVRIAGNQQDIIKRVGVLGR